jgi:hypothetical protein
MSRNIPYPDVQCIVVSLKDIDNNQHNLEDEVTNQPIPDFRCFSKDSNRFSI